MTVRLCRNKREDKVPAPKDLRAEYQSLDSGKKITYNLVKTLKIMLQNVNPETPFRVAVLDTVMILLWLLL